MLARIQECILYRGFSDGEILNNMAELINLYESDEEALKAKEDQFFKSITVSACVTGFPIFHWRHHRISIYQDN